MEANIVTSIDGVGVVEEKNDLASFSLTLRAKDESLEGAKRQVDEKTAAALKMLQSKNMNLEGEIVTAISNFKLEHREGSERYPAGFQSISSITWTVQVGDDLDDIYRSCLKLDSNMLVPSFSLKDRESISQKALHLATENAKEKLVKECSLLDVSPSALKIHNWNFGYQGFLTAQTGGGSFNHNNYGVMGATGPQGPMGTPGVFTTVANNQAPVATKLGSIYQELVDVRKLEVGTTNAKVVVRVNYVWK